MLIFSILSFGIQAQNDLSIDGVLYEIEYSGTYVDYTIPSDLAEDSYEIKFNLLGADGGGAEPAGSCRARGGDGAYVTATFNIGTGNNDLQPGGTIRFIVGQAGDSYISSSSSADRGIGNGGGGTGILYTSNANPSSLGNNATTTFGDADSKWIILAVAGGGSGAFRRKSTIGICWDAQHGQGGRSSTSGGDGSGTGDGGSDGDGGTNGDSCIGCGVNGVAGAGALEDGATGGGYTAEKGGTTGGATYDGGVANSYGYGAGGHGYSDGSGGGGGYSGGGGGGATLDERGGGGGSYVSNKAVESSKSSGGSSEVAADNGYAEYQILQYGAPIAVCNESHTISLGADETSISLTAAEIENGSYDLGDGSIVDYSIDKTDCSTLDYGTQTVILTVTDDDGNTATCGSHITVNPDYSNASLLDADDTGLKLIEHSGSYEEFYIPYEGDNSYLVFLINGGDGGYARMSADICGTCRSEGGSGARVQGEFEIGCGDGQLEPGGLIRFIVGEKGTSQTGTEVLCAGAGSGSGGGGTAVLYKPYGCEEWEVLLAAGGGGGAYQAMVAGGCVDSSSGRDGNTDINGDGTDGRGSINPSNGGSQGYGGDSTSPYSASGGGYLGNGGDIDCAFSFGFYGGGELGDITGGDGGDKDGESCAQGRDGGFGFGGGGLARDGGAGGGGYSGGGGGGSASGGGGSASGGGGGGSYVNTNYAIDYDVSVDEYDDDPEHGYIYYQFSGSSYNMNLSISCVANSATIYLNDNGVGTLFPEDLDGGTISNCGDSYVSLSFSSGTGVRTYDCSNSGLNVVTLYASTPDGDEQSCVGYVWVADPEGPEAVCEEITVALGSDGTATIEGEDVGGQSTDNCFIIWYQLDVSDFTCDDIGENNVTLTVYDGSFNTSSCIATVTIEEPSDGSQPCCDAPDAQCQDVEVALNSDGNASISTSDIDNGSSAECTIASMALDVSSFDCDDIGENAVSLLVTDLEGNSKSCASIVTVTGILEITAACQDLTVELDAYGEISIEPEDIDNGSIGECNTAVSLSLDETDFTCDNIGTTTLTLTANNDDDSATCTANITIEDNTPPNAQCQNLNIYFDTSEMVTISSDDINNGSSDNCGITSMELSQSSFDCSSIGDNSITLTVADASGNTSTCVATVVAADNTSPSMTCISYSASLDDTGHLSIVAGDLHDGVSDWCTVSSVTASITEFDCTDVGDKGVTLVATDAQGNSSYCTATLTIEDTSVPNAQCQDLNVYFDLAAQVSITTEDIDNGSTDNCGIASMALSTTEFSCSDLGDHIVTLTVTDDHGNTNTCEATVTAIDNTPPSITCINYTVELDHAGNVAISASDMYEEVNDWCGVNTITINESEFDCTDVGAVLITVTASDYEGNTSNCTATLTIEDKTAANAQCQDIEVYFGDANEINIESTDIDNGSSDACGIASLDLSQTTFYCSNLGENTVTLSVTDENGNTSTCSAIVTTIDNTPPTINCSDFATSLDDSGNVTVFESDFYAPEDFGDNCFLNSISIPQSEYDCTDVGTQTVILTATDSEGNSSTCQANLTISDETAPDAQCQDIAIDLNEVGYYNLTTSDLDNNSSDACAIASYALSQTQLLCEDIGANSIILTVTDENGNSSTCESTVSVSDNTAPEVNCMDNTVQLDADGNATIMPDYLYEDTYDACGIASEVLSQSSFDCSHVGTQTITLTVTDLYSNMTTCTATLTVLDEVTPNAQCQDVTVSLDASGNGSIAASDVDNASSDACGIASLSLNQTSFDCGAVGSNTLTLTVTDVNGNTASCSANVMVLDEIAPAALCQDISIQLDEDGEGATTAQAIDNGSSDACGIASWSLDQTKFDCSLVGDNTVILTIEDENGNQNTCAATVTVLDEVAPVALCQDKTVQLDANGAASITAQEVDNNSNDACGVASLSLDQTSFDCGGVGENTLVLTVEDVNGNQSTCSATITVVDEVQAEARCQDVTIELNADGKASTTAEAVDNGSNDACGIATLVLSQTQFSCDEFGANSVTLTVSDVNGNTNTCSATVTVTDPIGPTPVCLNPVIIFNGESSIDVTLDELFESASSWDNCGMINVDAPTTPINITCDQIGSTLSVTVAVNDGHGNTASCDASIMIDGLPCGWTNTEGIGCDGDNTANYDVDNGVFSLTNDGCTPAYPYIGDDMSFVTTELCGDGYIKAIVSNIDGTGYAGIMMRNGLEEGAKKIAISTNLVNRILKEIRVIDNYPAWPQEVVSFNKIWLKIERIGIYFKAYASEDDVTYTPFISQAVQMDDCIDVGLFIQSATDGNIVTADFEEVTVENGTANLLSDPSPIIIGESRAEEFNIKIEVFPNPAVDYVNIHLKHGYEQIDRMEVFNHLGQSLHSRTQLEDSQLELDVSTWESGAYLIRFQFGDQYLTKRLIITRE